MNVRAWSPSLVGLGGNYEVEFHTLPRNLVLNKARTKITISSSKPVKKVFLPDHKKLPGSLEIQI